MYYTKYCIFLKELILFSFTILGYGDNTDSLSFHDITNIVFPQNKGHLVAYGDWDGNMKVDIFILELNNAIRLNRAEAEKPFQNQEKFSSDILISNHTGTSIESLVPSDFDGDSALDVLCVYKDREKYLMEIYWGDRSPNLLKGQPYKFSQKFLDQPLILDYNGDMLPDILGETAPGSRVILQYKSRFNFTQHQLAKGPPFWHPQAHAFVDMNGDLAADLVLTEKVDDKYRLSVYYGWDALSRSNQTIALPDGDFALIGQASFLDFDADGHMDILLPVCEDAHCIKSKVYVYSGNTWHLVLDGADHELQLWPPDGASLSAQLSLRSADLDLDGFPDVAATVLVQQREGENRKGLVFLNMPCPRSRCSLGRTLEPLNEPVGNNVVLVAFFDIGSDGVMDLLVEERHDGVFSLVALRTELASSAYFLKVTVSNGLCYNDCPHGRKPAGVNAVGPTVRFSITRIDGSVQRGIGTQLSQTAYQSLQSPLLSFGLNDMPNFVDSMDVGVPNSLTKRNRHKGWTFVIPNSALLVIPYPLDQPSSWRQKLFVQPSRNIVYTGVVLAGLCALLAILVAIMHYREWREDEQEKKQESHKFHFDAM